MKKIVFTGIILALIFSVKAYAYDDHDFQIWNTDAEDFKINKDLKGVLEEEFRWGDNAGDFYYQHYDLGFFYSLNEWLALGSGYRHILSKSGGDFKIENEPYMTATLLWQLMEIKFDDRSRLEYQHFDYQVDAWKYRNKLTIKFPWKFTEMEIQPYLADEIFLGFQNKSFSRNRFYSGLSMNLAKNLKTEVYYMLQSSRSGSRWIEANVLGTKVKLSF